MAMSFEEIKKVESEIREKINFLEKLRKENKGLEIKNYAFQTLSGKTSLLDLFGKKDKLVVIHNMGQGCRWCTSWADGLNGVLPHIESQFSVVLVSKDTPEVQRQFALTRGWRFTMASHGGGEYITEQTVQSGENNMPGVVCYEKKGDKIYRKNASCFGPGDLYNPLFHIVSMGGISAEEMPIQYFYWKRPEKMDDGGQNLL